MYKTFTNLCECLTPVLPTEIVYKISLYVTTVPIITHIDKEILEQDTGVPLYLNLYLCDKSLLDTEIYTKWKTLATWDFPDTNKDFSCRSGFVLFKPDNVVIYGVGDLDLQMLTHKVINSSHYTIIKNMLISSMLTVIEHLCIIVIHVVIMAVANKC